MKKGNLAVLLLLLICSVTVAEIYKWVDESGKVHYGDAPPPEEADTQSVEIPEGPSQEEVERAKQEAQERKEQYEKFLEKSGTVEPSDNASKEANNRAITPDNVACFTPLSDLVQGPSAEAYAPITPTSIGKSQKELLHDLFGQLKSRGHWRGIISDLECLGSSKEPKSRFRDFEVKISADWDTFESRLTLKADITGEETTNEYLIYRLEIGDALYFNDHKPATTIILDRNKVEVLALNQDILSFLIKRYIPAKVTVGQHGEISRTTRQRGEIRHLEITSRTLKLIELYYFNEMLMASRSWTLNR